MDRTFAFLEQPALLPHTSSAVEPPSSRHRSPPPPPSSSSSLRQPQLLAPASRALEPVAAHTPPPPPPPPPHSASQFQPHLPPQPSHLVHNPTGSSVAPPPSPSHYASLRFAATPATNNAAANANSNNIHINNSNNNNNNNSSNNPIVSPREPFQMRTSSHIAHSAVAPARSFGNAQSPQMLAPNQPSFTTMPNLSNAMLSANVVDDAPAAAASPHFVNAQSNEALNSPAYPWDATSSSALASNALSTTNPPHQSIMPLHLVAHTPPTVNAVNNSTNPNANNPFNTPNPNNTSFGNALNPGLAALGSSFNSNVVRAIVSASSVPPALQPQSLSPIPASLAHSQHQPLKKPRSSAEYKPAPASRNLSQLHHIKPPVNAPLTSPVSTATIPNIKSPLVPVQQSVETPFSRTIDQPLNAHIKGLSRVTEDASIPLTSAAVASATAKPIDATSLAAAPSCITAQQSISTGKQTASSTSAWQPKRSRNSRPRSRRKASNGPTIPVHLRNPKKGRARVFRECKHCQTENHIRRSDCVSCQRPLPPGKRRRDGNPLYDRRRMQASSSVSGAQTNNKSLSSGAPNSALKETMSVNK